MDPKALLRDIGRRLTGKPRKVLGPFNQRIKNRHKRFWRAEDSEIVADIIMRANDPIEKWKDVEHWQRKMSNKYNAREFAKKHGCQVPELYWSGRDIAQFPFDKLPDQYVIRPTIGHSSRMVFLMNQGVNMMNGQALTNQEITAILEEAVGENIRLKFLVEEFLKNEEGEHRIPNDFKMYLFNGELAGIEVIQRLGPTDGMRTNYDERWRPIDNFNMSYPKGDPQTPPKCLAQMIADGKRLSRAYEIFARIDFYATDRGAVFGEFTPTPHLGNNYSPESEQLLAQYWDRFCPGKI